MVVMPRAPIESNRIKLDLNSIRQIRFDNILLNSSRIWVQFDSIRVRLEFGHVTRLVTTSPRLLKLLADPRLRHGGGLQWRPPISDSAGLTEVAMPLS